MMKFNNLAEQKEIKSNLIGESFASEISDPKLMMLIVRDKLYSHKLRTPIQEYISNAIDAQREAGTQHLPIQIVMPTSLEPVLKIRDFGTGMSEEKVRKTFSQYTASDKRTNLAVIGGYGLGSKSAFAYTDKFTIVSYYNKEMHSYLAYAPSELDLVFTPLFKGPTSEANGVEIHIAIKPQDFEEAQKAVLRIALLMPVKPTIINFPHFDYLYKEFKNQLLFSTENFKVYKNVPQEIKSALCNGNHYDVFINYNGIPYSNVKNSAEINKNLKKKFKLDNFFIELIAPANSLSVPPAREMLTEDDKYNDLLKKIEASAIEWNSKLFENEKLELNNISTLNEFDTFFKKCNFHHEGLLNIKNGDKNLTLQVNRVPVLLMQEDIYIAKRKIYRGTSKNTATIHQSVYVPPRVATDEEKKRYDYDARDFLEKKVELNYDFIKTVFLKVDNYFKSADIFHTNKIKHFLESNSDINTIIFVTPSSALYNFAKLHIKDVKKAGNSRDLIEYYVYKNEHGDRLDSLVPGTTHFNNMKTYRYIQIEEGTTSYPIENWIYSKLTKKDERIIFITAAVVEKIKNRKKFIAINLEDEKNKDPNTKLTKKQKEFVAIQRFFKINEDHYQAECRLANFLLNQDLDISLAKKISKNKKEYDSLAEKYELSLIKFEGLQHSYYSKFDSSKYPYIKKLLDELSALLITCPILKIMTNYDLLKTGKLSAKEVEGINDYIKLKVIEG